MNAAIYYTLSELPDDAPIRFSRKDRLCLGKLLQEAEKREHAICAVYVEDTADIPVRQSIINQLLSDGAGHLFDFVYLYLHNEICCLTIPQLSDILNLPVDGRDSVRF